MLVLKSALKGLFCAVALTGSVRAAAGAVVSATIIPSSYVQGDVTGPAGKALQQTGYKNTAMSLSTWNLNTGGNYAVSDENPVYQLNKLLAFGNGGTVTMQLTQAFTPVAGEKDLGIFTAQALSTSGAPFNNNMEAAILVSSDGQNWFNLTGQSIQNPTSYVAQAYSLNAPMMAYNYGTGDTAWKAGSAKFSAAQLGALPIADYTTPMLDDSLFNGSASTNAQRKAFETDTSTATYAAAFGSSGGGNWFDVSGSGLSSISYVMLNGDANDTAVGTGTSYGVRLVDVFVNAAAVPEPTSVGIVGLIAVLALKRRPAR